MRPTLCCPISKTIPTLGNSCPIRPPDTRMSIHKIDYDADTEVRFVARHQNIPVSEHCYFEDYAINATVSQTCRTL